MILHCFLKEAIKGSIPHAKALMTIAGMDKENATPAKTRARRAGGSRAVGSGVARTLSEMLLMELQRSPEQSGSEPEKRCT